MGADDVRLLLGGMRDVHRRQERTRGSVSVAIRDHPVNARRAVPRRVCREHETIHVPTRARYPLLREDQEIAAAASRLGPRPSRRWQRGSATCRRATAPMPSGVISTGQLVTEEFYALGKLAQLGLGTRNYDGNTTLCMATAVSGYKRSFGSDGPPGAYEDLERADVILLIGANIADNHPILWQRLRSESARKTLIVVDPRVTKTAMLADVHLPLKPRSDLALINGLIHILIEQRSDRSRLHRRAHDGIRGAARIGARVHAGAASRKSPDCRRS